MQFILIAIAIGLIILLIILGLNLLSVLYNKKNHKLKTSLKRLIAVSIFAGFFFRVLPGSDIAWWPVDVIESKFYTKRLTGHSFFLTNVVYEWTPQRHFNGDGKSLHVYKVKSGALDYFKNPNADFFKSFPRTDASSDYKTEHWKSTPLTVNDEDAYWAVATQRFNIKDLMQEKGNYYAYEYKSYTHGTLTIYSDVDFYIICPRRKLFIHINYNS